MYYKMKKCTAGENFDEDEYKAKLDLVLGEDAERYLKIILTSPNELFKTAVNMGLTEQEFIMLASNTYPQIFTRSVILKLKKNCRKNV